MNEYAKVKYQVMSFVCCILTLFIFSCSCFCIEQDKVYYEEFTDDLKCPCPICLKVNDKNTADYCKHYRGWMVCAMFSRTEEEKLNSRISDLEDEVRLLKMGKNRFSDAAKKAAEATK